MSQGTKIFGQRGNIERFIAGLSYSDMYGATVDTWYKPFTTNASATGMSRYKLSLFSGTGTIPSGYGFIGADSSGLNPFGRYTLGEGIISGSGRPEDLDVYISNDDVRTFGNKNPMTLVGWGFDVFGYPSPNQNIRWHASGIYQTTTPSSFFLSTGITPYTHGRDTHPASWNAGPMDARWDPHRKIWTSPQSVYAGRILGAFATGVPLTDYATPVFASGLRYNAKFFDGVANQITVTGALHLGPKPYQDGFKVYPATSGSFCFIVHAWIDNKPGYGIFLVETPGLYDCTTSDESDPNLGSLSSFVTYSALLGEPLAKDYGGTGFDDYPANALLLGDASGTGELAQYQFTAGTGIAFENDGINFTIRLASGVAFIAAGVNNNITQLTGLTTPLSVGQGGTGSSTKNFLDLTTAQATIGLKTFSSGIRVSSGTVTVPSIAFGPNNNLGLFGISTEPGMGFAVSGIEIGRFVYNGLTTYGGIHINTTISPTAALNNNAYAPLIVTQYNDINYLNPIQLWNDRYGSTLSYIDYLGRFVGQSLVCSGMTAALSAADGFHMVSLHRPNDTFRNSTISATASTSGVYFSVNWDGTQVTMGASGSQTAFVSPSGNRTINWGSGYTGDVPVAKVGGGTRTLSFNNGLFTGYTDS